jgi:hypothetical protein
MLECSRVDEQFLATIKISRIRAQEAGNNLAATSIADEQSYPALTIVYTPN